MPASQTQVDNATMGGLPNAMVDWLLRVVDNNGPRESDFPGLHEFVTLVARLRQARVFTEQHLEHLWNQLGRLGTPQTLMGHVYRKPHGYAGDFKIIDAIYSGRTTDDPTLRRWDDYFLQLPAVQAVRNRGDHCLRTVDTLMDEAKRDSLSDQPLAFLSLGCGPCRDLEQVVARYRDRIRFVCVDQDTEALDHARERFEGTAADISFVPSNVLRMQLGQSFDIAWSAGLFDYLNDRLFVAVAKRIRRHLKPGGWLVIGNFGPANPSRPFMEFGNWHLIHRTEDQLHQLCDLAGFPADRIRVERESTGINLFVHAQRD